MPCDFDSFILMAPELIPYFITSICLACAAGTILNPYSLVPYYQESGYFQAQKTKKRRLKIIPDLRRKKKIILWLCLPLFILMVGWGFYLLNTDWSIAFTARDMARGRARGGIVISLLSYLPYVLMVGFGIQILFNVPSTLKDIKKRTNEQREFNEAFENQGDELSQEDNEMLDNLIQQNLVKQFKELKKQGGWTKDITFEEYEKNLK